MALYSGRSLFQVHYTDYEEFPRLDKACTERKRFCANVTGKCSVISIV